MHRQTMEEIVREVADHLNGRFVGKVFQVTPLSLAIDFGLREAGLLFIGAEPSAPRLHLIKRSRRELAKVSASPTLFVQALQSKIGGSRLASITKDQAERIVRMSFVGDNEIQLVNSTLIAQLTGRSANLLLLDNDGLITHALRPPKGAGQQIGEPYIPPPLQAQITEADGPLGRGEFETLSAAADEYYRGREAEAEFTSRAKAALGSLRKQLATNRTLKNNLEKDLAAHGDPDQHKRLGDLLLANIATAAREANKIRLKDYYAEGTPEIEIEVDENVSLQDEAGKYFGRYGKAKRARKEIAARLEKLAGASARLEERLRELEEIVASGDEAGLNSFAGPPSLTTKKNKKSSDKIAGVRRYRSSDGYEILVGRAARVNDQLTFRVARPNDLWLHAADYPGPHVVVRRLSRTEIPQRTILEAAQLAAKFSQAGNDSKVSVHYTPRKFLSKPKGAAPGLVRMSTFRTLVVQPGENVQRIVD